MYILSADTAAKTASVCVSEYKGGVLLPLSHASVNGTLTHSESLLPMIDFCLSGAELTFSDIGAAVISNGPGSFTGVRIGVATFKGLGFADQSKPFIGVSTLEALAYNLAAYPARTLIFPVMDARRMQFYNAAFTPGANGQIRRLCADRLDTFDALYGELKEKYAGRKIRLVGDGAMLFYEKCAGLNDGLDIAVCDTRDLYEDAFSVARASLPLIDALPEGINPYPSEKLGVIYLRASQAERERNQKEQAKA